MGDTYAFRSEIEMLSGGKGKQSPALTKRSSMNTGGCGNVRKALTDVTNSQRPMKFNKTDRRTPHIYFATTKEYIDNLQEENSALKKQLAERNKIIELTGSELQRLRVTLQMMQQQNWQLAQANSQILAELETGNDRLKAMEHELGCFKCLLSVKNQEVLAVLEEDTTKHVQHAGDNEIMVEGAGDTSTVNNNENKPSNTATRRLPRGALDTASSTSIAKDAVVTVKDVVDAVAGGHSEVNREHKRRQSSRLKLKAVISSEYLFQTDDTEHPVDSQQNDIAAEHHSTVPNFETQYDKNPKVRKVARTRPLRRAAVKVQTYKELPLNVKIRRPD